MPVNNNTASVPRNNFESLSEEIKVKILYNLNPVDAKSVAETSGTNARIFGQEDSYWKQSGVMPLALPDEGASPAEKAKALKTVSPAALWKRSYNQFSPPLQAALRQPHRPVDMHAERFLPSVLRPSQVKDLDPTVALSAAALDCRVASFGLPDSIRLDRGIVLAAMQLAIRAPEDNDDTASDTSQGG